MHLANKENDISLTGLITKSYQNSVLAMGGFNTEIGGTLRIYLVLCIPTDRKSEVNRAIIRTSGRKISDDCCHAYGLRHTLLILFVTL